MVNEESGEKFGRRLEQLLEECGLSQRQLSEQLHMAATTLNGYVREKREPDHATLIRLAQHFQVTTDYLLGITDIRKEQLQGLDIREKLLIRIYRGLQPEKQDLLIEQAYLLYRKFTPKN